MNYQIIESAKKIKLELTNLITTFSNSNNEKEGLTLLINIVDNQNQKDNKFNMAYKSSRIQSSVNIPKISGKAFDAIIGGKITSLCQLKNGIAVGDIKGNIHCFTLTKNQLTENLIIHEENGNDIKYLYSLKNGHFISSIYNEFKIYEISKSSEKIEYKVIQKFKYNKINKPEKINIKDSKSNKSRKSSKSNKSNLEKPQNNYYYQTLELINNNLLYIEADRLYMLKPYNSSIYKDKAKEKKLEYHIISMAELNNNRFCIYCEDKCLYIYDSNSFKEKSKFKIKTNLFIFSKIKYINNDIIAALGDNKIFLISEAKQDIVDNFNDYIIYDIDSEPNKLFASSQNNIIQLDIKVNREGKYFTNVEDMSINCSADILYLLNNEVDEKDKIGKIALAYKNESIKILLS